MYNVGDKIFYPNYGAGIISAVEEKIIGGKKSKYYVLLMPGSTIRVLIPVDKCDELCVRGVIDIAGAKSILERFRTEPIPDEQTWNRRQRENIIKIRTGDVDEILSVLKGLMYRDRVRGLSTSERKLLNCVKQMVVSELVLSGIADKENIENILDDVIEECINS